MKISTRGRYALRVMIDIALQNQDSYISLTDIAKRQEISNKYLEQIIGKLLKVGYLKSARGNSGGYMLSKKASEYKVGDILRVMEEKLSPTDCIIEGCSRQENCRTFSFWKGLDDVINEYIDSKTLEDLIKGWAKGSFFFLLLIPIDIVGIEKYNSKRVTNRKDEIQWNRYILTIQLQQN